MEDSITVTKVHRGQRSVIKIRVLDIVTIEGGNLTFIRTESGIHYVTETMDEIAKQVEDLLNK